MGRFTISSSQPKSALSSWSTRAWGRKMFFTSGTNELTGVFSGGIIGAIQGLRKADHSLGWRLRVNSVMNGATRRGSKSGNTPGVYGLSLALLRQIYLFLLLFPFSHRSCHSSWNVDIGKNPSQRLILLEVSWGHKWCWICYWLFISNWSCPFSLVCLFFLFPFSSSFKCTNAWFTSFHLFALFFSTFCCVLSLTSPWMPSLYIRLILFSCSALGSFICLLVFFRFILVVFIIQYTANPHNGRSYVHVLLVFRCVCFFLCL